MAPGTLATTTEPHAAMHVKDLSRFVTICLILKNLVTFQRFRAKDSVSSSVAIWSPTSADFKTCRLTTEGKEKFLHEHNKFRGMVQPNAADMESMMVLILFTGQNLAREYVRLSNPEDRVKIWYDEYQYWTFGKYTSPMGASCTKTPCGHYTQIVWAKAKYLGCGVNFCSNFNGECPLKCQNGGTVNKQDCVCSCASGWRGVDCSDEACEPGYYGENCENRCYDKVGTETCQFRVKVGHKCSSKYMEIDCALTCGYCDPASGQNQVTTTAAPVKAMQTALQPGSITSPPVGMCSSRKHFSLVRMSDRPVTEKYTAVQVSTTTPNSVAVLPTPEPQEVCTIDRNSGCERWAAVGECEKNPVWMIPNCCVSCKHHQASKDCSDSNPSCPRWAYARECENNRAWMLKNCRKSCNQCGDCTDSDPKCPSWALSNQCSSGDKMNEKCRRSCGLCRVYDRHKECSAWSAMDECKKSNWTWMVDQCPRSCDVPFSEASFCGGKDNGDYQAPTTCQAYIACSYGVTSHVKCPAGKKFDTVKRMCVLAEQASCTVVLPSKKSKPFMMVTL
ncbi:multiple epidermal growth factor-like domains protein 10 [Stylophora pistillata]|uniref:multiple epidermal growth factor-like domains protein 10 n=1 Tax=Stylophora pistillata TaxID=50429 RepID=UPI000C040709|nr:multiple epidermal growth factor-like domains protein 10 [Stylophora pistillata]